MTDNELSESESENENVSVSNCLVGGTLKSQRKKLNMTQDEVASKLNLDVSYIAAIEEDDFSQITSMSYVNGYIRSYARLLKIPEQQILEMCQQKDDKESNLVPNYMDQRKLLLESSRQNISWIMLFIIVTGLLVASWWFIRQ